MQVYHIKMSDICDYCYTIMPSNVWEDNKGLCDECYNDKAKDLQRINK